MSNSRRPVQRNDDEALVFGLHRVGLLSNWPQCLIVTYELRAPGLSDRSADPPLIARGA